MEKHSKILIIDDDIKFCGLLVRLLKKHHYRVQFSHSGEDAFKAHRMEDIDLVLLDVMMKGENGFEILRKIRTFSDIPVIMLTARGDASDRITGLQGGADDYLPKPFEPEELVARINAILRRKRIYNTENKSRIQEKNLIFGNFLLDTGKKIIESENKQIKLTLMEFRLLEYFSQNPNHVLSRSQITEALYGDDFDPFRRAVDILVSRVRKKMGMNPESQIIKTVHGHGYIFRN